jgi:hypothetical protein
VDNVAIFPVVNHEGTRSFRAVTEKGQSEGRTVGEALDAVCATALADSAGAIVIIQPFLPDSFFTASQRARLEELMNRWRGARDGGTLLGPAEHEELQNLIEAELQAAIRRSEQIRQGAVQ